MTEGHKGKILVVVTSNTRLLGDRFKDYQTGSDASEAAYSYYEFISKGYKVEYVSPMGGEAPIDEKSRNEGEKDEMTKRWLEDKEAQHLLKHTQSFNDVKFGDEYCAMYVLGGHGAVSDLPKDKRLHDLILKCYTSGRPLAASAHGPAAFVDIMCNKNYLLQGRRATGFTHEEEKIIGMIDAIPFVPEDKMRERGADFKAGMPWLSNVVVDDSKVEGKTCFMITGQNQMSAQGVANTIVEMLAKQ